MTFAQKLRSRKFLLVIATFISGGLVTLFDIDIDPVVVVGFIVTALGYIGVEGLADNSTRKLDGSFAVRMLQAELQTIMAQVQDQAGAVGQDFGEVPVENFNMSPPPGFPPYDEDVPPMGTPPL